MSRALDLRGPIEREKEKKELKMEGKGKRRQSIGAWYYVVDGFSLE